MQLEFNWTYSNFTDKQIEILEKRATKWAEENLSHGEYTVSDDKTADACAADYISESLWSFSAPFLAGETGLDERCFRPLQDLYEDANPAFRAMIDGTCGIDKVVQHAIATDGRGHFLSQYDGTEYEFSVYVQRKRVWLYAYRNN